MYRFILCIDIYIYTIIYIHNVYIYVYIYIYTQYVYIAQGSVIGFGTSLSAGHGSFKTSCRFTASAVIGLQKERLSDVDGCGMWWDVVSHGI